MVPLSMTLMTTDPDFDVTTFFDIKYLRNDTTLCLKKNPCDYVFDDNLNSKRPIVIIFTCAP